MHPKPTFTVANPTRFLTASERAARGLQAVNSGPHAEYLAEIDKVQRRAAASAADSRRIEALRASGMSKDAVLAAMLGGAA